MKKAFVISAAAFIAIGAAVSSSTKANAEDNASGVGPYYPACSCPAQRCPAGTRPITIALITIAATIIALIIDVTITIAAITENLTLLFFPGSSSAELRHACFKLSSRDVSRHCRLGATPR